MEDIHFYVAIVVMFVLPISLLILDLSWGE